MFSLYVILILKKNLNIKIMTFYSSLYRYSTVGNTAFFPPTALENELKNYGEEREGDLWNKMLLLEFLRQSSPV